MEGSGQEELWLTVFAKYSVVHMVTGHTDVRASRLYFLAPSALCMLILGD